ncbi:hypothetical protein PYW07_006942 [Mythimna separata]|uniref:Partial AB-hydrolase lipase domain-containing protein n=1 Tax=Mythimna separata TaxID=271217 RepID=A0AAD7Z350_MYTSE|nr:hypothetical protein PYW07_006942 [Mythimna separata]
MVLVRLILGCVLLVVTSSNVVPVPTYSVYQTIEQITADGYKAETHKVTTSDGYILEMHRIPESRLGQPASQDRPVVFLMHGLMSASQAFVMLGPDLSLAYNLADSDFDVWMGNARGNKNSRFHTTLNPDDEEQKYQFFDFSFEEIGMYDLPAMIDYILEVTKKDKLHYIGHSQGGTVFLVMASMLPEYNQKLESVHLLAGVGYQDYFPNAQLQQTAVMTDLIYSTAVQMGAVELYPPGSTEMLPGGLLDWPSKTADYCLGNVKLSFMCELFGVRHIMPLLRNNAAQTDQAGAALKQIAHYGQNIRDKLFRRYNYGSEGNIAKYGTAVPPPYDLSLITTFVTMHYTLSDDLLDEKDVLAMTADIPKAIARQVPRPDFTHGDFVAAADAKDLVTDYIVEAIKTAGQEDHFTENDGVIVEEGPIVAPDDTTTTAIDVTTTTTIADTTTTLTDDTATTTIADTTTTLTDDTATTTVADTTTTTIADTTTTLTDDTATTTIADTTTTLTDDTATTTVADTTTTTIADTTASSTDAATATTPADGGAATIVINAYLIALSLYVMLK